MVKGSFKYRVDRDTAVVLQVEGKSTDDGFAGAFVIRVETVVDGKKLEVAIEVKGQDLFIVVQHEGKGCKYDVRTRTAEIQVDGPDSANLNGSATVSGIRLACRVNAFIPLVTLHS